MGNDGDKSETAKDPATMEDLKGLESSMTSLSTSMASQMQELRDMMSQFILANKTPNSSTSSPPNVTPVVEEPLNGAALVADTVGEEEADDATKAKADSGPENLNKVPPPKAYSPDPLSLTLI